MTRMNWQLTAILIVLMSLVCGCGSGAQREAGSQLIQPQVDSGSLQGMPAFPTDEQAGPAAQRDTSVALEFSIGGGSAFDFNGTQEAPFFMRLTPADTDDLKYSVYRVPDLLPIVEFSEINLVLSELTTGANYHFGFADYTSGRWELTSREAPGSAMNVELSAGFDGARNVSPAGNIYIAVIVDGGEAQDCVVEQLDFSYEQPIGIPEFNAVSKGIFEDEIFIAWNGVFGADTYDLFYKEADQPDDEYSLLLAIDDPFTNNVSHRDNFPPGKEAVYGVHYEYRIRANAGLETGEFSEREVGFMQTPQPRLYTTPGALADAVELNIKINPFPDNYTIDLFRDGELVLDDIVMTDSYSQILIDEFLGEPEPIAGPLEYTAIVNGAQGPSLPSEPVIGCISEWDPTRIDFTDVSGGILSDIAPGAGSSSGSLAIAYHLGAEPELHYALMDTSQAITSVKVADAESSTHPAIANLGGRPWVAYIKTDDNGGARGLYVARGSSADPTDGGSFSPVQVHGMDTAGHQVRMEVVDGRLALMWAGLEGGLTQITYYAYATVPDPQQPSDWVVLNLSVASVGLTPVDFDLADDDGRPAIMALDGQNLIYSTAPDASPQEADDFTSVPIDSFANAQSGGVDMLVHDGLIRCAVLYSGPGIDTVARYFEAENDDPGQSFWDEYTIDNLQDARVRDIALTMGNDGFPLVVLRDVDNDWPLITRPFVQVTAMESFDWSRGAVLPDEDDRDISTSSESSIRVINHNGQVFMVSDSTNNEIATFQELHVIRELPKQ